MTKEQKQGIAARVVGVILSGVLGGATGWTAVVKAAEKAVIERAANTKATTELKVAHESDMDEVDVKLDQIEAVIQEMQIGQAKFSTTQEAHGETLKEINSDIKILIRRSR
jgi:hypothetical protein